MTPPASGGSGSGEPDVAAQCDAFAAIYDAWVDSAPVTRHHVPYYAARMAAADGLVVELGVGNGRISIEACCRGARVLGVDHAPAMLDLARRRAEAAGVADRLALVQADFRDFEAPEPLALVVMPFHSIGHLLDDAARRACFERVRSRLRPGGRFLFDHFVFDPERARVHEGVLRFRAEYEQDGAPALLWQAVHHDPETQRLVARVITDRLDADGLVTARRVQRLDFSWIDPDDVRRLLAEAGLEVVSLHGDFDGGPWTADSGLQIWEARRP